MTIDITIASDEATIPAITEEKNLEGVVVYFFWEGNFTMITFVTVSQYLSMVDMVMRNYKQADISLYKAQMAAMNTRMNTEGASALSERERMTWTLNVIYLMKIGLIPNDDKFGVLFVCLNEMEVTTV